MVRIFDKAKVDFIVNEEKGIVVAKFSEPREMCYNCAVVANSLGIAWSCKKDLYMEERFKKCRGIARCAAEDTFDIKIGKKLALRRLKWKTLRSYLKLMVECQERTEEILNDIRNFIGSNVSYLLRLENIEDIVN